MKASVNSELRTPANKLTWGSKKQRSTFKHRRLWYKPHSWISKCNCQNSKPEYIVEVEGTRQPERIQWSHQGSMGTCPWIHLISGSRPWRSRTTGQTGRKPHIHWRPAWIADVLLSVPTDASYETSLGRSKTLWRPPKGRGVQFTD
jgi:hypothetical protein